MNLESNEQQDDVLMDESYEDFTHMVPEITEKKETEVSPSQNPIKNTSAEEPFRAYRMPRHYDLTDSDSSKETKDNPVRTINDTPHNAPGFKAWQDQVQRQQSFAENIESAGKWSKILLKSPADLPQEIKDDLYSPDFPEEWQHNDVKKDIAIQWVAENMPQLEENPDDIATYWESIKESVAEGLGVPADDNAIYDEISERNRSFTSTVKYLNNLQWEATHEAFQNLKDSHEADPLKSWEDKWEETSRHLPEEIKTNAGHIMLAAGQYGKQKANELLPTYYLMRQMISQMSTFESIGEIDLSRPFMKDWKIKPVIHTPINLGNMVKTVPHAFDLTQRLKKHTAEERNYLFEMVENDIIEEREKAELAKKPFDEAMGQGIQRSLLKPFYGAANILGSYYALLTELTAKGVEATGLDPELADFLKEDAQQIRDEIAHLHRLRRLAETRENPLRQHEDGRGAGPENHWIKECMIGFSEESLAIALALSYPPSLFAYGTTQVGNHYAENESGYQSLRYDSDSDPSMDDSPLGGHMARFGGAVASGTLQTAIEASAYGRTFKPIVKSLPKTSRVVGVGFRPFLEQKGISLSQPLGEATSNYATDFMNRGLDAEFRGEKLARHIGNLESNLGDYAMSLPFVLLAFTRMKMTDIRLQKAMVNDPALIEKYKIPKETVKKIRKEKNGEEQARMLQEALRESPYWEHPEVLIRSADLLNNVDATVTGSNTQLYRFTPATLKNVLDAPIDQLSEITLKKGIKVTDIYLPQTGFDITHAKSVGEVKTIWHAQGGLPTISPFVQKGKPVWKIEFPYKFNRANDFRYYTQKPIFSSPEKALEAWQKDKNGITMFHLNNAINRRSVAEPFTERFKPPGKINEQAIKNVTEELSRLPAQKSLLKSNHLKDQASLDSLKKSYLKEHERVYAHTIEDALLYHAGLPSDQIAKHRVTHMWLSEIKEGRIHPKEAEAWIKTWEKEKGETLRSLAPESISTDVSHRDLAGKLTDLSLNKSGQETTALLPASFTEPSRLVIEQLSHASTLADQLTTTSFYNSKVSIHQNKHLALAETLESYLDQDWSITQKYLSKHPRDRGRRSSDAPPPIKPDYIQDLQWMAEQNYHPIFSITDKAKNTTHWVTQFPDGTLSKKHPTPQEAFIEWTQKGIENYGKPMARITVNARDSLDKFLFENPRNKMANVTRKIEDTQGTSEMFTSGREDYFYLINPHMKGNADLVTLGSNGQRRKGFGHRYFEITEYTKTDPFVILEERAEVVWKSQFLKNTYSLNQAKTDLIRLGRITGENYLPANIKTMNRDLQETHIVEALSQVSHEYLLSNHSNPLLPKETGNWIRHMYARPDKAGMEVPMLRRSTLFKRMETHKQLSPKFLELLKESVGLSENIHRERLFMGDKVTQRERILPFLSRPSDLLANLPEGARLPLIDRLVALESPRNIKRPLIEKMDSAKAMIERMEKNLSDKPELKNWDYNPADKKYYHLETKQITDSNHSDIQPKAFREKQLPDSIKDTQSLMTIKTFSALRRSVDDLPYSTIDGIRWRDKIFSVNSKDRPGKLPPQWEVIETKSEFGIRYFDPENAGHVIRVTAGETGNTPLTLRTPYVRHVYNGHFLNENGQICSPLSAESYIPLEKFNFDKRKISPDVFTPPTLVDKLEIMTRSSQMKRLIDHNHPQHIATSRDLVFQFRELGKHVDLSKDQRRKLNDIVKELQFIQEEAHHERLDLGGLSKMSRELIKSLQQGKAN